VSGQSRQAINLSTRLSPIVCDAEFRRWTEEADDAILSSQTAFEGTATAILSTEDAHALAAPVENFARKDSNYDSNLPPALGHSYLDIFGYHPQKTQEMIAKQFLQSLEYEQTINFSYFIFYGICLRFKVGFRARSSLIKESYLI